MNSKILFKESEFTVVSERDNSFSFVIATLIQVDTDGYRKGYTSMLASQIHRLSFQLKQDFQESGFNLKTSINAKKIITYGRRYLINIASLIPENSYFGGKCVRAVLKRRALIVEVKFNQLHFLHRGRGDINEIRFKF